MKALPIITVIIPIYNVKKYLKDCVESVLSQTYRNLEIILVDDGSTDGSSNLADDFAKVDQRIKVIHQKNLGLSGARNSGLKITTGEYVTFVDSDDRIEPNMISGLFDALTKSDAGIAVCSFKELRSNGKFIGFSHNHPKRLLSTEEALTNMLQEKGFMTSATMKLFPFNFFKNIKFPAGKLHEDVGTTYKLIMKAAKIIFIPDEYYIYIHHDESIVNQSFDDRKLDLIELTDQMCDNIEKRYPALSDVTNERRMRARFSILRQIPINNPNTKKLLGYLKSHKSFITENPKANRIDKIALKLALTNLKIFQLSYKLFK